MKNKFGGPPSADFARAMLRKHINHRATFIIGHGEWLKRLTNMGFSADEPIIANGIFSGIFKKPPCWPNKDGQFILRFRDLIFKQGDLTALVPTSERKFNKRVELAFCYNEITIPSLPEFNQSQSLGVALLQVGYEP